MGILSAVLNEIRYAGKNIYDHAAGFIEKDLEETISDDKNPVIAVHGYCQYKHTFRSLRDYFRKNGRTVIPLGYHPFIQDVRRSSEQVARSIEEILEKTGAKKVDIVGHSLGGLVTGHIIKMLDGDRYVDNAVAVGTPFEGTRLGFLAPGKSGKQIRPGSRFLDELNSAPMPESVNAVSVYSDSDELLIPYKNGRGHDWKNVMVSGIAHLALIYDPATLDVMMSELGLKNQSD